MSSITQTIFTQHNYRHHKSSV